MTREDAVKGLRDIANWHYGKYEQTHEAAYLDDGDFLTAVANKLKEQEPRVMKPDLPPEEYASARERREKGERLRQLIEAAFAAGDCTVQIIYERGHL